MNSTIRILNRRLLDATSAKVEAEQEIREKLETFDNFGNKCECGSPYSLNFEVDSGTEVLCLECGGRKNLNS